MRFNQATVASSSSAVSGDQLVIISGIDTLNALNRALGGGGIVSESNRTLTFPKEVAHPTIFQDRIAVWAIVRGNDVVLLGRASDECPNDLYVYTAPSGIAGSLMEIGPCSIEWGDSGRLRRTWFYEMARLTTLPEIFRNSVPHLSMEDVLREVREGNERLISADGQKSNVDSPFGALLGLSLLSSLMGADSIPYPARMGQRRRNLDEAAANMGGMRRG